MRGMINGEWHAEITSAGGGLSGIAEGFSTPASKVTIDHARLRARPQSYHLYVAHACPFAHRTLLARAVSGLNLPTTTADPWLGGPQGWQLESGPSDPVPDAKHLWQVYQASDENYTGRVSVPVLWDCEEEVIASADSREIMDAILATNANGPLPTTADPDLAALTDRIVEGLNLAVYRVGFAEDQQTYDVACDALHEELRHFDRRLRDQKWIWGDQLSAADLLLFATGIRFDVAYHGAFLLLDLIWRDFPGLQEHLLRVKNIQKVSQTVRLHEYRIHYFDDSAFTVRKPLPSGHWIVPRTFSLGVSH